MLLGMNYFIISHYSNGIAFWCRRFNSDHSTVHFVQLFCKMRVITTTCIIRALYLDCISKQIEELEPHNRPMHLGRCASGDTVAIGNIYTYFKFSWMHHVATAAFYDGIPYIVTL